MRRDDEATGMWANSFWGCVGASLGSLLSALVPDENLRWWQMRAAVAFAVIAILILIWPWIWKRKFPRPCISGAVEKRVGDNPNLQRWEVTITLKPGLLFWVRNLKRCRLYLIRRDWGPLTSRPEGIWLKWIDGDRPIEELETTLTVGRTYRAIVVERDDREGIAYVANERFVESGGTEKKWALKPKRDYPEGAVGRYTFELEVGQDDKRWSYRRFYAVHVPPAGAGNDGFKMEPLPMSRAA